MLLYCTEHPSGSSLAFAGQLAAVACGLDQAKVSAPTV